MTRMPRAKFAIQGNSFMQIMTRTLPSLIEGLNLIGLHEYDPRTKTGDYVVGQNPPSHWPKALAPIKKYEWSIATSNGTLFQILSQKGQSSRGSSFDGILVEEALEIDAEKFMKETNVANRAHLKEFGHDPLHQMVTMVTSMPYSNNSKWILEKGDYLPESTHLLRAEISEMLLYFIECYIEKNDNVESLWNEIRKAKASLIYQPLINEEGGQYYSEADVFDNIEILGLNYIIKQYKSLLRPLFKLELLNCRNTIVGTKFYNGIGTWIQYLPQVQENEVLAESMFERKEFVKKVSSKFDTYIDSKVRLDIGLDYGSHINCLVAGQLNKSLNKYIIPASFYALAPENLDSVVGKFCEYFDEHENKVVNFYYDHTALTTSADRTTYTHKDSVIDSLKSRGWKVSEKYIGVTAKGSDRFTWYQKLFGKQFKIPMPYMNAVNAKSLYVSMDNVTTKEEGGDIKKNKAPERNMSFKQQDAPHLSDAFDTLYYGQFGKGVKFGSDFLPNAYG